MTFADASRIASDPAVCGGRPVISGTRLRVADVLDMLAGGVGGEDRRRLSLWAIEDVRTCLAFATRSADHAIVLAAA